MAKKRKKYLDLLDGLNSQENLTVVAVDDKPVKQTPAEGKFVAPVQALNARTTTYGKADRSISTTNKTTVKEEDDKKWYQEFFKGSDAFDDGYDFGDVTKTILGSGIDVVNNAAKGILGVVEGVTDLAQFGVGATLDLFGADKAAEKVKESAKKSWVNAIMDEPMDFYDQYSIFGDTTDAVFSGVGQGLTYMASGGLGAVGKLGKAANISIKLGKVALNMPTLAIVSGAGSGLSEAYNSDENIADWQAWTKGIGSGMIEGFAEGLFGMFGVGGSSLDDAATHAAMSAMKSGFAKAAAKVGVKAAGEGVEEQISYALNYVLDHGIDAVSKLTGDEARLGKEWSNAEFWENFFVGTLSAVALQGGGTAINITQAQNNAIKEAEKQLGRNLTAEEKSSVKQQISMQLMQAEENDITVDEQKVLNSVIENRVDGQTLTNAELKKIRQQALNDLRRGYVSTEDIENTLLANDNAEIAALKERLAQETDKKSQMELQSLIAMNEINKQTNIEKLIENNQLFKESYLEQGRKSQAFTYEETDNEYKKAVYEDASKIMNNTNRAHDFVETVAKIAEDRGTKYRLVNNAQIKELGYGKDGKTVNGLVTKDGEVLINVDSKKALNAVLGHETTHLLEGTQEAADLKEFAKAYAESIGDYTDRVNKVNSLYANVKGVNIENEITADIVGEYLFTDEQFINELSAKKPNIFQKIYNYVKHLYKMATAGSAEARQLEQLKYKFEKAYKNTSKQANTGTKYSLGEDLAEAEIVKKEIDIWLDNNTRNEEITESDIDQAEEDIFFTAKEAGLYAGQVNEDGIALEELLDNDSDEFDNDLYADVRAEIRDKIVSGLLANGFENSYDRNGNGIYNKLGDAQRGYDELIEYLDENDINYEISRSTNAGDLPSIYIKNSDGETIFRIANHYNGSRDTAHYQVHNQIYSNKDYANWEETIVRDMERALEVYEDDDTKYSLTDNQGRELTKAQQEYFKDSKARDENGNLKVYYHGTQRADRIGTLFDPSRATSGPMAFFTDSKEIGDSYSKNKADTSLSREYDTEYDLFKINGKTLDEYWNSLSKQQQAEIAKRGNDIGFDDDFENIVYGENASENSFGDQYKWRLNREYNGNAIKALYSVWIEDGNIMFEDLSKFQEILEKATAEKVAYLDPYKVDAKTYEVYLDIKNPLNTSNIPQNVIESLKEASKSATIGEQYSADMWDKSNIAPEDWIKKFESDIEEGTAHAWTVIPDWVTNVLKANGYDGIVDTGGKHGGVEHQVVIPFYSNQIKDVANVNPTDNPNIDMSLSMPNEDIAPTGAYNVYGKDVKLEVEETIAPLQESITELTEQVKTLQEQLAPINQPTQPTQAEIDNLIDIRDNKSGSEYASAFYALEKKYGKAKLYQALNNHYNGLPVETTQTEQSLDIPLNVMEMEHTPDSYTDEDMPISQNSYENVAEESQNSYEKVESPFDNRDIDEVGKRNVKAYMYENPEVKPFFQEEAKRMLTDLRNSIRGERVYLPDIAGLEGVAEQQGGFGWTGTKRQTTEDIAYLKDKYGYSYNQIEEGLKKIIQDDGKENNAVSKRIEFMLDERLKDGYTDITGTKIPPNQYYISLLAGKEITEYHSNIYKDMSDKEIMRMLFQRDNTMEELFGWQGKDDSAELDLQDVPHIVKTPFLDQNDSLADSIRKRNNAQAVEELSRERNELETKLTNKLAKMAEKNYSTKAYQKVYDKHMSRQAEINQEIQNIIARPNYVADVKHIKTDAEQKAEQHKQIAQVLAEEPATENNRNKRQAAILAANVLDKGLVFENLSLKSGNRELQGKWDYTLTSEARAQNVIGNGHTKGGAKLTKSLNEIRAEVDNSGLTQDFYNYMYHKLNVDRMTLEERYALKNKPVFGDSVTAEQSQELVNQYENTHPEFMEWAQDVYDYVNADRQQLVNNGVISQETADYWSKMYPHYVPIRRADKNGNAINVPLDTGRTGINAPVKKATGGSANILPLFDTMALRTLQTYRATAKNSFGIELMNTIDSVNVRETTSMDEVIDSIDAQEELLQEGKNGKKPTFTVFDNGEKITFEITENMYDALKPLSDSSLLSKTNKVLNTATNIRRGLLTEYNPVFMLTNGIKDVQDILLNSQHAAKTYAKIPEAYAQMVRKGYWYQEYMENGGQQNSYFDSQDNNFKEEKGITTFLPLKAISRVNNFIELAPRLAEYIASREAGASIETAMLDAARVTTNFKAGGNLTKFLNRNGATFLNASVQGAMQQVRNVREANANGIKGWANLLTKYAIAGLPALMLNGLMWDDDEEYEELSDYVKQNYYIVAKNEDGTFVRIPKGRAVAVIQEALTQMGNLVTGDDEADLKSFLDLVVNNLAPNNPLKENIFAPITQAATNTAWYGGDLVPKRLQDLPAEEQYDESTDAFSKWLGGLINVSPYKINYVLDQYSGGIGDVILPMLTPEAENGKDGLLNELIAPLNDKFTTNSTLNNQNVTDFYDLSDELTTGAKKSNATDEDVLMNKYINSVKAEMSELYIKKREIQNSDLPDSEKYQQVLEVQRQINELAKEALSGYKNVTVEENYSKVEDREYRINNGEWTKLTDKQLEKQNEVTKALGITPNEYWSGRKEEYDYAYENPAKYTLATTIADYETYKGYTSDLYDLKADKDEDGKSISGSRKEKVIEYVNNLDIDYGQRLLLFKSEYNADDTYNQDIIDYLNEREDVSYEQMKTILIELGFEVDSQGSIYW